MVVEKSSCSFADALNVTVANPLSFLPVWPGETGFALLGSAADAEFRLARSKTMITLTPTGKAATV